MKGNSMHDPSSCSGCGGCSGGGCPGCGGCDRSLTMTQPEIDFLLRLAQTPFLPVGRALGEQTPIFENDSEVSAVLQLLEKKSLISIDYRAPLKLCRDEWYLSCPVQGSLALTERGQQVLDLIDYQGIL